VLSLITLPLEPLRIVPVPLGGVSDLVVTVKLLDTPPAIIVSEVPVE